MKEHFSLKKPMLHLIKSLLPVSFLCLISFLNPISPLFSISDPFLENLPSYLGETSEPPAKGLSIQIDKSSYDTDYSVNLENLIKTLEHKKNTFEHILLSLPETFTKKKSIQITTLLNKQLNELIQLDKRLQKIKRDLILFKTCKLTHSEKESLFEARELITNCKTFLLKSISHFHAMTHSLDLIQQNTPATKHAYVSKNTIKILLTYLAGETEKNGKIIGKGAFGNIYLVQLGKYTLAKKDPSKSKLPKKQSFHDNSLRKEIAVLASCKSKGLISPLLFEWAPPRILMPLSKKGTLHDLIHNKTIPPKQMLHLVKEITLGLDSLHKKRIIHHDIKPANILLFKNHARICDFGLMGYFGFTNNSGTPYYYSPEKAKKYPLTGASDLWSLGIVLYKMLYKTSFIDDLFREEIALINKEYKENMITKSQKKACYRKWVVKMIKGIEQDVVDTLLLQKEQTHYSIGNEANNIEANTMNSDDWDGWISDGLVARKLFWILQNLLQVNPERRLRINQILDSCYFL